MMSEEKKQVGDEAMKKRPNNIDENFNKTAKSLLPKNNETRQLAKMTRKSLAYALEGQPVKIKMALDILFDEDPRAYIDAIAKLMNYAMPKLSSTEIKKDFLNSTHSHQSNKMSDKQPKSRYKPQNQSFSFTRVLTVNWLLGSSIK